MTTGPFFLLFVVIATMWWSVLHSRFSSFTVSILQYRNNFLNLSDVSLSLISFCTISGSKNFVFFRISNLAAIRSPKLWGGQFADSMTATASCNAASTCNVSVLPMRSAFTKSPVTLSICFLLHEENCNSLFREVRLDKIVPILYLIIFLIYLYLFFPFVACNVLHSSATPCWRAAQWSSPRKVFLYDCTGTLWCCYRWWMLGNDKVWAKWIWNTDKANTWS